MSKRMGSVIRRGFEKFENWRSYSNSRKIANRFREEVIKRKGGSVINRTHRNEIEEYAVAKFGQTGYSAWLLLYTELREEFKQGWIPDDFYSLELIPELNPRDAARVSTMKSFDHRIFNGFAIDPVALVIAGSFFDRFQNRLDKEEFEKLLHNYDGELVIKRDSAPSGQDIIFKQPRDITANDFKRRYNYLIQPSVNQHPALAELYSMAVNTVRITTLLNSAGTVEIKHCSLRFGTNRSKIVNTGGLFLYLNREGEVISPAMDHIGLVKGEIHPDTGVHYRDVKVPSMAEAIRKCKVSHLRYPYVRFIAWDLFIDEEGDPRMIEWNAVQPDMWVNEALIGPLWQGKTL